MKKRSSVTPPSGIPNLSLAARYQRVKQLRQIVQEAERWRLPRGELKTPGSRINPQRRHSA